jgi:Histidine kinase/Histidine kinase-, DNA gyrase B-, and HSP90-like ATPase
MEFMPSTTLFVAQIAAAVLHLYLARCFYPDRHRYERLCHFMWVMLICAAFHLSSAALGASQVLGVHQPARYLQWLHTSASFLLVPTLLPGLLLDYSQLPAKPNLMARCLVLIHRYAKQVVWAAYAVSFICIVAGFFDTLQGVGPDNMLGPFGEAEHIASFFGVVWLLMLLSGLRPVRRADVFGPFVNWAIKGRVVLVSVALIANAVEGYFYPGHDTAIHFVTVPFGIIFAWYRYRWVLVDVIAKRFIGLLFILTAVYIGALTLPLTKPILQPFSVIVIALMTYGLARVGTRALDSLWMPGAQELRLFKQRFSLDLGSSVSQAQAIAVTEKALGELFTTDVGVNRTLIDLAQTIEINESPYLEIRLGHIKGIFPWFSESLAIANEVALQLHNHLKLMGLRAKQHQQDLNMRELQTLAARAERDAMRAQIRPHFLFNVLNTLHSFVRRDPEQAERVIELLSELMRGVVDMSERDTYPLYREIELAEYYLQLEKIRYGERLRFSIEVDQTLACHQVPPFSIQPLVENAVKFSVDEQLQGAEVHISARRVADKLLIRVTDNGPGLQCVNQQEGLGVAINNIRERIDKLYGKAGSLQLFAGERGGARAELVLPFISQLEKQERVS